MINYIIQVIIGQLLFLIVYEFWIEKETFFNQNRIYLLLSVTISFVAPLIHIPFLKSVFSEYETIYSLPEIIISPQKVLEQAQWYKKTNYLNLIFWIGLVISLTKFCIKCIGISRIIIQNKVYLKNDYKLIILPKQKRAFSFFNYIFIGNSIPDHKKEDIIKHELIHCKQKHSVDLIILEILKVIMWFNPLLYIYQKKIALVHEFITDELSSKENKTSYYINSLLSEVFDVEFSLVNTFYKQSFLKKRITMLTKKKSNPKLKVKFLLLIPIVTCLLIYTSCNRENIDLENLIIQNKTKKEKRKLIAFNNIDTPPSFEKCKIKNKKCFNETLRKFIGNNFNTKLAKSLGLKPGKKKIFVLFHINENGKIVKTKVRAPHPKLEEETIRVLKKLPKIQPGKHNGKKVTVGYVLPIIFESY